MQKVSANTGVGRQFKDIFELGVPAFREFYYYGVFVWKFLWKGFYKPWHIIPAPTVANAKATRNMYRLDAAKAICAEMAGLVWGDDCEINVSIKGREATEADDST